MEALLENSVRLDNDGGCECETCSGGEEGSRVGRGRGKVRVAASSIGIYICARTLFLSVG